MMRWLLLLTLFAPPAFADYAKDFLEFQRQLHKGGKKDFETFERFYKKTSKDDLFVEWLSAYGLGLGEQKVDPSAQFIPILQMLVFINNEAYCWLGVDGIPNAETGEFKHLRLRNEHVDWDFDKAQVSVTQEGQLMGHWTPARRCPYGFLELTVEFEKQTLQKRFFVPHYPSQLPLAEYSPRVSLRGNTLRVADMRLHELSQIFGYRFHGAMGGVALTSAGPEAAPEWTRGPAAELSRDWSQQLTRLPVELKIEYQVRSPAEYGAWQLQLQFQKFIHSGQESSSEKSE